MAAWAFSRVCLRRCSAARREAADRRAACWALRTKPASASAARTRSTRYRAMGPEERKYGLGSSESGSPSRSRTIAGDQPRRRRSETVSRDGASDTARPPADRCEGMGDLCAALRWGVLVGVTRSATVGGPGQAAPVGSAGVWTTGRVRREEGLPQCRMAYGTLYVEKRNDVEENPCTPPTTPSPPEGWSSTTATREPRAVRPGPPGRNRLRPARPNGIGKTTAVRLLTTQQRTDIGQATVADHDVPHPADRVRARIGPVSQKTAPDEALTGQQIQRRPDRQGRLAPRNAYRRTPNHWSTSIPPTHPQYPGGTRRRPDLDVGPAVLSPDRPTTGPAPHDRTETWQHCGALVDQGTTVLLTTRYPDEVETGSPPHRGRRHRPRHGGQGQRRTRPDRMLTCGPLIGRQVRSGTAPAQTAAAPLFLLRSTPACRPAPHRQPPPSRPRGLLSAAVAPATMPGRLGAITRRNPMPVTVPATRELLGTPDWESPPGSTSTPSAWP